MRIYIPRFIHKYRFYVVTLVGLLLWIAFFDGSNLIAQFRLWQKLSELEEQQEYYVEELKKVKKEEHEVMGNQSSMEKFAREQYLMKKSGETVFVIVDEDNKSIEKENEEE
ncbi:Septum formation initiator [Emticicia oligotrophica DSM 17448]|uniref:Septum formation initiator n=1 Tax=Emticicia oligotrophica (strain DSM 17448 / CIP 109782 / MTCC 6937 / GPTSA100-15) TaxID=929562 RepID=A0ABM5N539_EMTOG|nr:MULTISPECIES: septum formation initiator family protein [Emticicia]AFK04630.1 Septum formation initiator [Emticicia oligotrophica DSM 17448]